MNSQLHFLITVHKLKNVTLEVTPEESPPSQSGIPQQVEIIQADHELAGALQLSDNVQVIDNIQHVQVRRGQTYTFFAYFVEYFHSIIFVS